MHLAAFYGGDFSTTSANSALVQWRQSCLLERTRLNLESRESFSEIVLEDYPSVREIIDSRERSFAEFLKLLDKAHKFKTWLIQANPDQLAARNMGIDELRQAIAQANVNQPVGLIDGVFRANLEETGMGYGPEVDMIRLAHEMDLLTSPYVFDVDQAKDMARAGADILVPHMGLTTGGAIGAETALTLADCVPRINAWAAAAKRVKPDVIVLCHGGPIANPEDAEYILRHCPECHGFYGASSMERLPVEGALTEQTRKFKAIRR